MNTENSLLTEELPQRPTIRETAAYLRCTDRTVRNYIAAGSIKGYRIGPRTIRLDRDSVIDFASRPLIVGCD